MTLDLVWPVQAAVDHSDEPFPLLSEGPSTASSPIHSLSVAAAPNMPVWLNP